MSEKTSVEKTPFYSIWKGLNKSHNKPKSELTNENDRIGVLSLGPKNWGFEANTNLGRQTGDHVAELLHSLYEELHKPRDPEAPAEVNAAEIAAVVSGTKPLFHEQIDKIAHAACAGLKKILPQGLVAEDMNGHLVVYRPDLVKRIFDSAPSFYRPNRENDKEALQRVIVKYSMGELLGYGQRTMNQRGSATVTFAINNKILAGFKTRPQLAKDYAAARASEYFEHFRKNIVVGIE